MSFNSPLFFIFLTAVISIHYYLPQRYRALLLLAGSFVFIGFHNIASLTTLVLLSIFNFYIAKNIQRPAYLLGILINAAAILLFSYFNTAPGGFIFSFSAISFDITGFVIALGLSFYSLQNIAYLTEIYFKHLSPEHRLSKYMLYNAFFPKIISGPVLLPAEFIPQISGFNRLLLGLFKKMVIADRLFPAVHSVFDFSDKYHGLTTLAAAYLFTVQLYFDFSGYTDMALGISKMLGYNLKENFNLPLRSTSVSEFWRRWHISLISWFSNYIYYPLVYRLRNYKKMAALTGIAITFLISGIWHGTGFTFLAWAFCHAIYLGFELLTKKTRAQLSEKFNNSFYKLISIFIVFNLVCFSNIFFRASSFERAIQLIKNTFTNFFPENLLRDFVAPLAVGGHQLDEFNFYISIVIATLFLVFERKINRFATSEKWNMIFVVSCILMIMLFGIFNSGERFIYMQF